MIHDSVLFTGMTRSLGTAVLQRNLEKEPSIKAIAVLRSASKSEAWLASKHADAVISSRFFSFEISDMSVSNAFDAAAVKSDAIVHVTAPLTSTKLLETMIKPACSKVANFLSTAQKFASVELVIVTGRIVSNMSLPNDVL